MKQWRGGALLVFVFVWVVVRYGMIDSPLAEKSFKNVWSSNLNSSNQYHLRDDGVWLASPSPGNALEVVPMQTLVSGLFGQWNFTSEEQRSLQTWNYLKQMVKNCESVPHAIEAIKEARVAWENLVHSVQEEKMLSSKNNSSLQVENQNHCPYSIRKMNSSDFSGGWFRKKLPCGLTQGSSITFIGTPVGLLGEFRIDLTMASLPGEPDPPIILHYNVRLSGDKVTDDPVIVQNTWSMAQDWGYEERCPSEDPEENEKVDGLDQCNKIVGMDLKQMAVSQKYSNKSRNHPFTKGAALERKYFPFRQGHLAVATLRVGIEGIHMTIDGKHITSFAHRETLEPWLASEVRISGDIKLISVLASGLPASEDFGHVVDLEALQSPALPLKKPVNLLIGIFSTANNFKLRMAARRTWLQYDAVRSGAVSVRFFVGLHTNQVVNEEVWNEARTYGDVQLMPFVDYYHLITWKTLAICLYGTNVISAKYLMKTDDDAFVRVDELIRSLEYLNVSHGLLYGRINSDSQPHRDPDSKWYISFEEWQDETYPPWAHGPGYVISQDIAKDVYKQYKRGSLRMFKLEDVAMGIWIADMQKRGKRVYYMNEGRIYNEGCEMDYLVAHYQGPRDMLCLWKNLQETGRAMCCGER